ncbi:hypothetical protein A6770_10015 [Nostoc minutum NIES-26]|uniref:Uncharacterized protein n=1 Tax=Nostoc minutum NIES-26 TaxID=1844469 RepID=A0A367RVU2_9NOSO|nr:hypothetical protein A6770_10015 [Nostoc minutum NIES-26]
MISPPSLVGKGAGGLGFALAFPHDVKSQGQRGEPLITLKMPPKDKRQIQVNFLYPTDSTPPQVLTVKTES